jgi:ABC-type proline/glycine betaine transport system ATPase subunit
MSEGEVNDKETPAEMLSDMKGAFVGSLVRNNKKIREDRAIAIAEAAEMLYKRQVEDTELKIKQLRRDRETMLDLSPTDAQSLVLASDFDAKKFVEKDIQLGVEIRNLEITLDIAKQRYNHLFKN